MNSCVLIPVVPKLRLRRPAGEGRHERQPCLQGLLAAMQKRVAKKQVSLDEAAVQAATAIAASDITKNEKVRGDASISGFCHVGQR